MTCARCGEAVPAGAVSCSRCGATVSGVYRTTTVLVGIEGQRMRYPSVGELPPTLREACRKSTEGARGAHIVIADSRGLRELCSVDAQSAAESHTAPSAGTDVPRWPVGRLIALGLLTLAAAAAIALRWR